MTNTHRLNQWTVRKKVILNRSPDCKRTFSVISSPSNLFVSGAVSYQKEDVKFTVNFPPPGPYPFPPISPFFSNFANFPSPSSGPLPELQLSTPLNRPFPLLNLHSRHCRRTQGMGRGGAKRPLHTAPRPHVLRMVAHSNLKEKPWEILGYNRVGVGG